MPKLGETKRGKTIGYKGLYPPTHIWAACEQCKKERWVHVVKGHPRYRLCRHCANTTEVMLEKRRQIFLDRYSKQDPKDRRGENCQNWKGGRRKNREGYILIKLQPEDFFYPMINKGGYVLEHRLVMAKSILRNLHSWEVVHHKNAIKDDNRIENLQLVSEDKHNTMTLLERQISNLKSYNQELLKENLELRRKVKLGV